MLAGRIEDGTINVPKSAGIEVVRRCSGDSSEVVNGYISGNIYDNGEN